MFGSNNEEKRRENHIVLRSLYYSLLGVFFIFFLLALVVYANRAEIFQSLAEDYTQETDSQSVGNQNLSAMFSQESRIETVAQNALPSVVSVVASQEVPVFGGSRDFGGFTFGQDSTREQEVGGGSGFFVSADGLIVTNKHVVSSRESDYSVVLNDGTQHEAEVVARDPFIDIAFLRITDRDNATFQPLTFTDEEEPRIGQTAIAIGNALGQFQNTLSVGIVSGLSRSILAQGQTGIERLEHVIQTDAAVNPGNSGGPLLSLEGDVIGVNVAVAQGTENIAFSIPGAFVSDLAESVEENGRIIRPFVGIRYIPVSSFESDNDIPVDNGALVVSDEQGTSAVVEGSPADEAGLEEGDIILSINGEAITPENSFGFLVRQYDVGEEVTLNVLRNDEEQEITLTLQEAPDDINS